ncbi:S41 family peptidase [Rasiella sp. SM2506]|uniref:S41 family peptidase n=1 Tax=Rasiella sp. SM2506 TaxID=3423914 RepID=UPI003D794041
MKKFLCSILLVGSIFNMYSQTTCDCTLALNKVIVKIESDYPGFEEKTKDTLLYNNLKKQLVSEAKKTDTSNCLDVLLKFTTFFKDRHIWILPNEQESHEIKEVMSKPKQLNINIAAFKRNIKKSKDKLEGIWKDETYTVGVTKTGINEYTGFIIETTNPNWKPKEIKFQLNKENITYYLSDHSIYQDTFKLYEDYLLYINNLKSNFIKQNLDRKLDTAEVKNSVNELDGFYYKKLTEKSSLIKISSFNYPYVERIGKLIEVNKTAIENSENLIIDIRNNGGGTDDAYTKLLPLLATNPIRNIGIELLSTQGLIDGVTTYKDGLMKKDAEKNKDEIKELENRLTIYKENFGKFINLSRKDVTIDSVQINDRSPKQIIILVNDNVASAGENFLLKAKQSKKVKVMGIPTSGVLDYANAYFFKFACENYKLLLPTYRSLRLPQYPIDNIGIQPDIYIDKSITDWEQFAIDYLEN